MRTLENRIPPPLVALCLAGCMWLVAPGAAQRGTPATGLVLVVALLVAAGLALAVAGSASFRRARTTVNPLSPSSASALVVGGVYRYTRNPMYLGMLLVLLALGAYLASAWALAGPVLFVAYMNRFQIAPEETALEAKFGDAFRAYKGRVRRWL